VLHGVAASPGIAIGPARRPVAGAAPAEDRPAADPDIELDRLDRALAAAREDVEAARAAIAGRAGEAEAAIFDAHALLLGDAALLDPARRAIGEGAGAAAAWRDAVAEAAATWRGLDDGYLRERAADVEDAGARVLRRLGAAPAAATLTAPGILVAEDVTPGDAAALDTELVQGLALARGGATSHAAILARALGIPSVAGLGAALLAVGDGTPLVLDGAAGTVEVDPEPATLAEREQARATAERRREQARRRAAEPARTRDGVRIEVAANVGSAADAAAAVELGAEGVGLLRTEFLFLDRDEAPGEEEQRRVYGEIAAAMGGRPVVVRTLDAGADKPLPFLRQPPEDNPFLGLRGIRLALARPELLRTQLRAILAVAAEHPVKVMFPMITTLAEYRAARAIAEEVRAASGAPPIEIGVMVEVPAVALGAERFAREVDFFSIGTNDLTQYTTAAERGNGAVADLLEGPVPAVLALVAAVTSGARRHGRWVGVCGELAGDPAGAVLLAGLGATELSMAASRIPEVKAALRGLRLADARAAAERALEAEDAREAAALAAPLLAASGPAGR
jgi:phosphocarrier protein FPr